ncbi:helix-turn-helix domain-containing protein [Anatilimnocola floriformis]|uniref:helix-turn-helix domain-containing protein n=1 Tax=Anatilimnocola floriformis TaxID=2948575 RepID=UPI0020C29F3F|nr:helix-turn-helix transcriptional regulator [Anatilimnocola floriformis]
MKRLSKTIHGAQQKVLCRVLQGLRAAANLRQEDVADLLGRPQSFVSKYESGERRLDVLELRTVCQALGSDLVQFVLRLEKELSETPKNARDQR